MATLAAVLDWRPSPPFYYGWLILAMSALATFAATGVSQVVLGGIQDYVVQDMKWEKSTIALAATAGTWTSGLVSPVVGRLTDRYGPRWLMPIGIIIAGTSFFILSSSYSVWQFYFAYILGRAVSNPILIGVVPRTAAVNFFRRRRNIALALSGMFRPVGGSINILIISSIAVGYGWRTGYLYLGALSFLLIVPLAVVMRRRPEDIGLLPDGARSETPTQSSSQPSPQASPQGTPGPGGSHGARVRPATGRDTEFDWTAREAFRTGTFWLVAITMSLGVLGSSTIGFMMVPYLREEAQISTAQAAGALSLSSFLAIANLVWGYLADRITPRWCLVVTLISNAAVILYLLTVSSLPTAYIFGVLWGVFNGSIGVLEGMVMAQYYGRASYGTITGTLGPLQMIALGLGPSLGALVRDATGTYSGVVTAMIGLYLLSAVLIFFARSPALPQRAFTEAPTRAE
jgi:MFS family permease